MLTARAGFRRTSTTAAANPSALSATSRSRPGTASTPPAPNGVATTGSPQAIASSTLFWIPAPESIGATAALDIGLVEKVVPQAGLDQAVEAWINAVLAAGPQAVRLQKALMRRWEELPLAGVNWEIYGPSEDVEPDQIETALYALLA